MAKPSRREIVVAGQERDPDEQHWKQNLKEQAFMRQARTPDSLNSFWETESGESRRRRIGPGFSPQEVRDRQQTTFNRAWDRAVAETRGQYSNAFLLQFSEEELSRFGPEDLSDEMIDWLEFQAKLAAEIARQNQAIDARVEATLQAQDRRRAIEAPVWKNFLGIAGALFNPVKGARSLMSLFSGQGDEYLTEQEIRERETAREFGVGGDKIYNDQIEFLVDSTRTVLQMMREGKIPEGDEDSEMGRVLESPEDRLARLSNRAEPLTTPEGGRMSAADFQRFWNQTAAAFSANYYPDVTLMSDATLERFLEKYEEELR
ncbi:MAG: hypothetical protein MN733_17110, partial [Nitrososphaera sp.]|nr:hypothetical protein [Nitrososphaera sp.]